MSFLSLFLLSCAGMLALSLSMPVHHAQVFGKTSRWPQQPWAWRILALVCLLLALRLGVTNWGPGLALATVVSATTVASMLIVPALSYQPRAFAAGLAVAATLVPLLGAWMG